MPLHSYAAWLWAAVLIEFELPAISRFSNTSEFTAALLDAYLSREGNRGAMDFNLEVMPNNTRSIDDGNIIVKIEGYDRFGIGYSVTGHTCAELDQLSEIARMRGFKRLGDPKEVTLENYLFARRVNFERIDKFNLEKRFSLRVGETDTCVIAMTVQGDGWPKE